MVKFLPPSLCCVCGGGECALCGVVCGGCRGGIGMEKQQNIAWDIIDQAIRTYDSWMLDDDFNSMKVLKEIMEQMRSRRSLYILHERET